MRKILIFIPSMIPPVANGFVQKLGIFALLAMLSACSVYRIDVQQGNTVEAEKVEQLRIGMTEQQVQFLLGSAMLKDPFHQGRWDYAFSFTPGGEEMQKQHLTLFFENQKLVKIDKSAFTGFVPPKRKPIVDE